MENKNISKVKRGEIYLYDFGTNEGSIQNGLRPALVVQCDEGNKASCTIQADGNKQAQVLH